MPYLGNIPATQFAELKYQDFTGGTGTSFTLNDPVGTAQELEVFVNNVRQEPGVAYTVSGTALTMTGSIVATDDFYVVFQGKSTGTATHPAGQALTATDGTFTGDLTVDTNTLVVDAANNRVGVRTSPDRDLHVKGASGDPVHLKLEGDPADYARIMFDDGTDDNIGEIRYHFGDDNLQFTVNAAERMRIDSSGNVGVNTSSPPHRFSIQDDVNQTALLHVKNDTNGCHNALTLESSTSADKNIGIRFKNQSAEKGGIGYVQSDKVAFYNGTSTSNGITINSDGHVGINDTNPTEAQLSCVTQQNESAAFIHCNASSMTGTTLAVSSSRNTTNGTYSHLECAIHGVAVKMKVLDSGNVKNTNNSYGSISDQRMKENIVDAASQWDDIKALQVRKYNRIGETQKELGVIAQELEASGMGGLVEEGAWYDAANNPDEETRKSVKYSILYMKAVKALQEAMTRIETLETENSTQATQIADLITRVTALEDA